MDGIQVLKVTDNRVRMRVLNIIFEFGPRKNGRGVMVLSRCKKGVQINDLAQLWIPDYMYGIAARQAAAILDSRKNSISTHTSPSFSSY